MSVGRGPGRRPRLGRRLLPGATRQIDGERRAAARRTVHLDEPGILLYDAVDRGQSQPRTFSLRLCRKERIEYPAERLPVHAGAVIGDQQPHKLPRIEPDAIRAVGFAESDVLGSDGDGARSVDRVACIDAQIGQDLVNLRGVHGDGPEPVGGFPYEGDVFADQPAQDVQKPPDDLVKIEHLRGNGLLAREGQKLAGEVGTAFRRHADLLEFGKCGVCGVDLGLGQLRVAENHAEHVVEIVRHASGQTAYGLQFLRLGQLAAQPLLFFLSLLALCDVLHRGHHADNASLLVPDHRGRKAGVEERAVLPAPDDFEICERLPVQHAFSNAGKLDLLVFGDNRQGFSQDFGDRPPEDFFGGGVPTGDGAFRVDAEQRHRRTRHHGLLELLALSPGFLGLDAFGDVVNDRVLQRFSRNLDASAEHLDVAHGTVREPMADAVPASRGPEGVRSLLQLRHGRRVDRVDVHRTQLVAGPAVEGFRGGIGVDNLAVPRVGDEHDRVIPLEEAAIAVFAFAQGPVALELALAFEEHLGGQKEAHGIQQQHDQPDLAKRLAAGAAGDQELEGEHDDMHHNAERQEVDRTDPAFAAPAQIMQGGTERGRLDNYGDARNRARTSQPHPVRRADDPGRQRRHGTAEQAGQRQDDGPAVINDPRREAERRQHARNPDHAEQEPLCEPVADGMPVELS